MAVDVNQYEGTLGALGKAWAWLLGFGVISILAGVAVLVWPGPTLQVIAVLFAIQLIVAGIFRFVGAFAVPRESGWLRALQAILAILSFGIGIYLLGHLQLSLLVLAFVLGFYWIASGVIELFLAIGHGEMPGRLWVAISGLLGIAAGTILVVAPGLSLFALTLVLGVLLIIFGVMLALQAWHARSAVSALRPRAIGPSQTT
jgi:uncharacterized membrane protein HdeD (DUF308 family)